MILLARLRPVAFTERVGREWTMTDLSWRSARGLAQQGGPGGPGVRVPRLGEIDDATATQMATALRAAIPTLPRLTQMEWHTRFDAALVAGVPLEPAVYWCSKADALADLAAWIGDGAFRVTYRPPPQPTIGTRAQLAEDDDA